jgi:hypothetical protein
MKSFIEEFYTAISTAKTADLSRIRACNAECR